MIMLALILANFMSKEYKQRFEFNFESHKPNINEHTGFCFVQDVHAQDLLLCISVTLIVGDFNDL